MTAKVVLLVELRVRKNLLETWRLTRAVILDQIKIIRMTFIRSLDHHGET